MKTRAMPTTRPYRPISGTEDASLSRTAEFDPHNPSLADAELARVQPAAEVLSELLDQKTAAALLK